MQATKLNPYTRAIINCLEQYPDSDDIPDLDETTAQFLTNMIQGRYLHYLVAWYCQYYKIEDKALEKQLSMTLTDLLSDKLFAVFREKVKRNPAIVYIVARRIAKIEAYKGQQKVELTNLIKEISREYLEYRDLRAIQRWIASNPEIAKIAVLSRIKNQITDPSLLRTINYILENDKDGVVPIVFNRYLDKNKIERLSNLIKSGEWKIEASFVQAQSAKLINWREYMNR